jgi:hypothetical protein
LQTDSGIEALVDLVKPLDPDAEVAFDRLDGIRSATAQVASIADANLSHTSYLGYYCSTQWQPGSSYFAMAAIDGGLCSFVVPARQSVAANVQPDAAAKASATRAVSQTRSITNPAAIQLYMDGFRSAQLTNGMSNSAGGFSSASTLTFGHGGSMERGSAATNTAAPAASTSGAARSSKP